MTGKLGFLGAPLALPTPASVSRPSLCRQGDVRMSSDKPAVENKAPQSSNKPAVKDNAPKSSATWANVWLPEFPRKGAGSVIGWDLRPTFFRPEPEAAVCDNCEGTGKIVCTICNGNDFMGPDGIVPCNACQGTHTVTCSTCYGTGRAVALEGKWWEWDFESVFKK